MWWLIAAAVLLIAGGCSASGGTGTIEESEEYDRIEREAEAHAESMKYIR